MNIYSRILSSGIVLASLTLSTLAVPAHALSSGSGWLSSTANVADTTGTDEAEDHELQERRLKSEEAEAVLTQHLLDTGHRVTDEAKTITDTWIDRALKYELFFDGARAHIRIDDIHSESGDVYRMEADEVDAFLDEVLYFSGVSPYPRAGAISTGSDDRYVYIAFYTRSA